MNVPMIKDMKARKAQTRFMDLSDIEYVFKRVSKKKSSEKIT